MLLNRHGDALLRVKGILNVADAATPVAVHAVQHLVHAPRHLDRWPDEDRRSRLEFCAEIRFASDSPVEESGFEPLVPLPSQPNRDTGPMSPIPSIQVASVIPLANSISISVATESSGSNPVSSSGKPDFRERISSPMPLWSNCRAAKHAMSQ
jgi:hypothetical protein